MTTEELIALQGQITPGPWRVHGSRFYGPGPDRILIGQMWCGGAFNDNLTPVAMAPDLLAEVIRLRRREAKARELLTVNPNESYDDFARRSKDTQYWLAGKAGE